MDDIVLTRIQRRLKELESAGTKNQFSKDSVSWHDSCEANDVYMRISSNGGKTWEKAITLREQGTKAADVFPSLELGETMSTAYRGDRGKTAYDHSQLTSGNPHGTALSDLGDDATHRLVTDDEKISWNNKQEALGADVDYITPDTAANTYAPLDNVLLLDNTNEFTPTGDFNPATKKFVMDLCTSVQTSANGKNTVYRQPIMPTNGVYITGDIWFDSAHGYAIYIYDINNGWVSVQFSTAALAVGAITAGSGIISDIDAAVIKSGILSAITIQACQLSAAYGSFASLIAGNAGAQRLEMGCDTNNEPSINMYDNNNALSWSWAKSSINIVTGVNQYVKLTPYTIGSKYGMGIFVN